MTNDIKGETIVAMGKWRHRPFGIQADTETRIEHIAIYLATRPMQRRFLSRIGAVIFQRI